MTSPKLWIPLAEASVMARMDPKALFGVLNRGEITGVRQGGRWLLDREVFLKWLTSRDGEAKPGKSRKVSA